ncbi:MAG TPA: hypothetical protein VES96_04035, partial [Nitrospiraceae bacterium]|nr:hypothetical protein [Nitrospiraceae bacterium]
DPDQDLAWAGLGCWHVAKLQRTGAHVRAPVEHHGFHRERVYTIVMEVAREGGSKRRPVC